MPDVAAPAWMDWLVRHEACPEGIVFCTGKTLFESWAAMPNGGWLLWVVAHADIVTRKDLARTALKFVQLLNDSHQGRSRLERAIRDWIRGTKTEQDIRDAFVDAVDGPHEQLMHPTFNCAALPWADSPAKAADASAHRQFASETADIVRVDFTVEDVSVGVQQT